MELHLALKQIIDTEGKSVLKEQRLINILSDLQAYESIPASKFIITSMINHDYISEILKISKWGAESNQLKNSFVKSTGFNDNYVKLIWDSFAYALGFKNVYDNNEKDEKTPPPIPSYAQNKKKHKDFFHIKNDGVTSHLIEHLLKAGFVKTGEVKENNCVSFKGRLFNYECNMNVFSQPDCDKLLTIGLDFEADSNINQQYDIIRSCITKYYGEPEFDFMGLTKYSVEGYTVILSMKSEYDGIILLFGEVDENSDTDKEMQSNTFSESSSEEIKKLKTHDTRMFLKYSYDGNMDKLIDQLKEDGFLLIERESNINAILSGKLFDFFCEINIAANPDTQNLIAVSITFDNVLSLEKQFAIIKESFTKEFGALSELTHDIVSFTSDGVSQILLWINKEEEHVSAIFNYIDNENSDESQNSELINDFRNNHLTFLNIPINGYAGTFVKLLEGKGLSVQVPYQDSAHTAILNGSFCGVKNCSFIVGGTHISDIVYMVVVQFPTVTTWVSLKDEYIKYKDFLASKYDFFNCIEKFDYPYEEGDGYEATAVSLDKCSYMSYFHTDNGSMIMLKISNDMTLNIAYVDLINGKIHEEEEKRISFNDL